MLKTDKMATIGNKRRQEDDVELIGEEFDNGDEEKALTTILLLDNSIDIDRRNRG